jgi:hypothetical protein
LITSFINLANTGKVGLIAKTRSAGRVQGFAYAGAGVFQSDRRGLTLSSAQLQSLAAPGAEVTYTLVVKGSETRLGVDRDLDTWFDGDEAAVCANPADPASYPGGPGNADVNGDLFVDFFDFDEFVDLFETGSPRADFNADGFVDFFDFDDFVLAFETGC